MKAEIHIQDPNGPALPFAADLIASAAQGAVGGRALFAFATESGLDLLFNLEPVAHVARRGEFDLIVGIDAITNRETLEALVRYARKLRGLRPSVFWSLTASGIFHPKLCHFWNPRRETFVIGSGNLTPRGLRDNFEAFCTVQGPSEDLRAIRSSLDSFLSHNASRIRDIDHAALERAAQNTFTAPVASVEPPQSDVARRSRDGRALVAELPRGGSRWQQANFDRTTARAFFGIDPSATSWRKDLFLSEVDAEGRTVRDEQRQFTFTKSRNLRLHLAARGGLAYPRRGRPIAVFRQIKPRHFVYQLLIPGDPGSGELKELLDGHRKRGIGRVALALGDLRRAWPACPLI